MKVISQKKIEEPKRVMCHNCGAELEYENDDIRIGQLGCGYINCPVCKEEILLDGDGLDLDESNIEFPKHFFYFGKDKDAKIVSDSEIQAWVRECIIDLKKSSEDYGEFSARETGNAKVIVCKYGDEFDVTVCQNYYSCSVPR